MNIKEVKILNLLIKHNKTTPLKSGSILQILVKLDEEGSKMSESTLRRCISKLIKNGYIADGIKNEQEKKYYITEDGIKIIDIISGEESK